MSKNRVPETSSSKIFKSLTRKELEVLMPKIDAARAADTAVHGGDIGGFEGEMFDTRHDLHVAWMNRD